MCLCLCEVVALSRKLIPLSQDGIFLDDLSNVVRKIKGKRVNHSIGWLRHPSQCQPLPVFEILSCNWKSDVFQLYFERWNQQLERDGPVHIVAVSCDWYTGFHRVCI